MPAPQRYCVHCFYTADAAPWAAEVFSEGADPAPIDGLPVVMVSPSMNLESAERLAQVFHDHVVEGPDSRDYMRGHA